MKILISISKMIVLLILILQGPAFAGPKLKLSEVEFDFGNVPQMAKISHDFWLYSIGDDTLKILKVSPG